MKLNLMMAAAVAAMGVMAAPMSASAATVDFSDLSSGSCNYAGNGNSAISQGFEFTDVSGGGLFLCNGGVIQNNTTPAMIAANTLSILDMAAVGGGVFSLQSFFAGGRTQDFNPSMAIGATASGIKVDGTTASGSVSQSFAFSGVDFSQFTLGADFTGLTSVRFTALGDGRPEFLINGLTVNEAVATGGVPEPAAWAFMLTGFAGAGAMLRRRRALVVAA